MVNLLKENHLSEKILSLLTEKFNLTIYLSYYRMSKKPACCKRFHNSINILQNFQSILTVRCQAIMSTTIHTSQINTNTQLTEIIYHTAVCFLKRRNKTKNLKIQLKSIGILFFFQIWFGLVSRIRGMNIDERQVWVSMKHPTPLIFLSE